MEDQQILPGFSVSDASDFESFYAPKSLSMVKSTLQQFVRDDEEDFVYLSGVSGTGKSHLLQAVCNLASEQRKSAFYLSLADCLSYPPAQVLEGIGHFQFVCLDDVDAIASHDEWQVAIFDLFNQRKAADLPLYFAAKEPAQQIALTLADLKSRLSSCLSFQLPHFDDEEKLALLQFRAGQRAMELNDACATYIIQRSGRNLKDLIKVLDRLDQETLTAGRKITVPFIKKIFSW